MIKFNNNKNYVIITNVNARFKVNAEAIGIYLCYLPLSLVPFKEMTIV